MTVTGIYTYTTVGVARGGHSHPAHTATRDRGQGVKGQLPLRSTGQMLISATVKNASLVPRLYPRTQTN